MWQHSETAEVAKSGYLKQDVSEVQLNWVAWLGICLGQNNGCLAIPNMLPPTTSGVSMDGCDLSAEMILFYGRTENHLWQPNIFTRKLQFGENPWFFFHKCRIWWLRSSATPRQLETVQPRSPAFTKLPLWPVLPVVPQYDKEKLNFIEWAIEGFFRSFNGDQTDQRAALWKVYQVA